YLAKTDAAAVDSSGRGVATPAVVATRRIGAQVLAHSLTACCPSGGNCPNSVAASEQSGLTAFTVIPSPASATAKYRDMLSTAALAEPMPTHGCQPPVTAPVW